jgi:hypothetical protein
LAANILRDIVKDPKRSGGHDTIAGGSFEVGKEKTESAWKNAGISYPKWLNRFNSRQEDVFFPSR